MAATKAPALETLQIAIELMRRIPKHRKVSTTDLVHSLKDAGLERDPRSIQRLLKELAEHYDIEVDARSKPFGYRWKDHAQPLAVMSMTPQQALLLSLSQQLLGNLLPAKLRKELKPLLDQAKVELNELDRREAVLARQWANKVRSVPMTPDFVPPAIRPGVMDAASTALYENLWLDVAYRNAKDKRSTHRVQPLAMVQQGPCMYLVTVYEGHDDLRHLAMHRIESARATDERFEVPKHFDLDAYVAQGGFGLSKGNRVRLTYEIAKTAGPSVIEVKLSPDQTHEDLGDRWRITATLVETEWLHRWLRAWGSNLIKKRLTRQP